MNFSQRIAILVDSENLEHSATKLYQPSARLRKTHQAYPNWKLIIPEVIAKRALVRNIYYKKRGLRISDKFRTFWTRDLAGEIRQPIKSVDPYIIVDAVGLAEKVDSVVILAGDKDYLPLIWYLKSRGCKSEMVSFPDAAAREIEIAADKFHALSEKHVVNVRRSP